MCTISQCVSTRVLSHQWGYDVSVGNTTSKATDHDSHETVT